MAFLSCENINKLLAASFAHAQNESLRYSQEL